MMTRPKADDAFQMKFFQVIAKYWQEIEGFLNLSILHSFRSKNIVSVVAKDSIFALGNICSLGEFLLF